MLKDGSIYCIFDSAVAVEYVVIPIGISNLR